MVLISYHSYHMFISKPVKWQIYKHLKEMEETPFSCVISVDCYMVCPPEGTLQHPLWHHDFWMLP